MLSNNFKNYYLNYREYSYTSKCDNYHIRLDHVINLIIINREAPPRLPLTR